jgi:ferredoxin
MSFRCRPYWSYPSHLPRIKAVNMLRGLRRLVTTVKITWVLPNATEVEVNAKVGDDLLKIAHAHGIELEGACEGSLACSTCHVILQDEVYDALPEPVPDEEDMLDSAYGLTPTSRLGCQVKVTGEMTGMRVKLPSATRNLYVDGHKPKPH